MYLKSTKITWLNKLILKSLGIEGETQEKNHEFHKFYILV